MGPALQPHIFVGQGPCALPWVRYGIGGRTESSAPTEAQQEVQWAGDRKGRPYGGLQAVQGAGRCGERTERCRWQRKRSERVAAVKILSVRRKAVQKFWAPQQDHRPLRRVTRGAVKRGVEDAAPYGGATRSAVGRDDVGIVPYGYITRGAVKNSPFRQGGLGDGRTDCHGQFENWPRNDRRFYMGCGTGMQKQVSRFAHLFFYHVLF